MSKTALTYRDYEALPDDGRRYEIHDGELSVTPAPSLDHQIISSRLYLHLAKWFEAHPGGLLLYAPLDVILSDKPDETSIVQPDILYVAPDRMDRTSPRGIEGGPTLAVAFRFSGWSIPMPARSKPSSSAGAATPWPWPRRAVSQSICPRSPAWASSPIGSGPISR
jgi:hypothetical protein